MCWGGLLYCGDDAQARNLLDNFSSYILDKPRDFPNIAQNRNRQFKKGRGGWDPDEEELALDAVLALERDGH